VQFLHNSFPHYCHKKYDIRAMKRTDLPTEFQSLLRQMPYVTVATTCLDGTPWNSPVVGYFDSHLNLYWSSDTLSQHSRNIATQPVIFVVLYDSSLPLGEGVGLYLRMEAKELTGEAETERATKIYLDRYGEDGHDPFIGDCPRRIYKATPVQVWTNIAGRRRGHFVDKRKLLAKERSA